MKRYALLSVYEKTGIVEFARGLVELEWTLLSTGGTARTLREAGLPVTDVAEFTGFPEMLDGRVKTLHPLIHGGLLGRVDLQEHVVQMLNNGIKPIDLVVVNLYPFAATVRKPGVTTEEVTEQIDIGGPSMLRSAAKNYTRVTAVMDPGMYGVVLGQFQSVGNTTLELRLQLMASVFGRTAEYDAEVADFFRRLYSHL